MSDDDRPSVLVVGVGNPDRGDDAVGLEVAARLRGRMPSGVRIFERSGDMLALIEDWEDLSNVLVVDAAALNGLPGRIHRLDLTNQPLPIGFARASTHAFGVAEAVELGRSLGRFPRRLVIYLIEGEHFETGGSLTPAVAKAVDMVADSILAEIAAITAVRRPKRDNDNA
jgi:hydrogenase maturation protease